MTDAEHFRAIRRAAKVIAESTYSTLNMKKTWENTKPNSQFYFIDLAEKALAAYNNNETEESE